MKRDSKKREKRKKWEPYTRKTIPSMFFVIKLPVTYDNLLPCAHLFLQNRQLSPHGFMTSSTVFR